MNDHLEDLATFKFFALQNPKPMSLLREIIWQWNRAHAFAPGVPGEWVALPLAEWCSRMGNVPRRTLQRWLKVLDDNGLLEREPHRFRGTKTLAFLRPTRLALKYMGKEGDLKRLTINKTATKKAPKKPVSGASGGAPSDASDGAVGGVLDHTTLPFHSTYSSIQKKTPEHTGGEGKAGKTVKKKLILKASQKKEKTAQPATTEPDDVDMLIAEFATNKLAKLLKQFPILQGAHANHVKHPYEMHGAKWLGWSAKLQKDRHAVYVQMVENWYQGKKGKPYKPLSYDDAEFDLDLDSIPDFEEALFKK